MARRKSKKPESGGSWQAEMQQLIFTRTHRHAGKEYKKGDALEVPSAKAEGLRKRLPVE